ncbi:CapA family protein [Pseudoalteromonas sp. SR43-7]|uniref:CapA family protein n=1 Tax=Pseudoalteromonas sp. SR43-7 TaxID=2760939 RepID=UPI0015F9D4A8|nr:CapA family protein [Pseudoalteromonas sp. SR43-7]MBB1328168.1 CapA family protein [Pseudoalteromonas sp. SR43-7]
MLSINFTGDVSFTGAYASNVRGASPIMSSSILDFIDNSDLTVINLEGPVTSTNSLRKDLEVKSPVESIHYLKSCNISCLNISNNHIFDCGESGYIETLGLIEGAGLLHIGTMDKSLFKVEIIERSGVKVALIGFTQQFKSMTNSCIDKLAVYNKKILKKTIDSVRSDVNWVVLNFHGGEEYTIYPWYKKRDFLKSLFKYSVDIIICHHSHTIQPYERIADNKYIFYSLGNFIFDLPNHKNKSFLNDSLILKLSFTTADITIDYLPVKLIPVEGKVISSIIEPRFFYDLQVEGYSKDKWHRECTRVVEERNPINNTSESKRNLITRFAGFLKKAEVLLLNPEFRGIVIGHLLNRLKGLK